MNPANTLYAALGLASDASPEEIEAAHAARSHALRGDADALSLVRVAYDTLRNPASRASYDRKLVQQQPPATAATAARPETPPTRPASARLRNGLLLLLAAAGSVALFLPHAPPADVASVPPPRPPQAAIQPAAPPPPTVAESGPLPPPVSPAVLAESAVAAPPPQEAKVVAATTPPAEAPPVTVMQPARGVKQAGFDAHYVAWSVFTIRQRNSSGSGVLIAPDRILTNCHVLAGAALNGLIAVQALSQQVFKVEKYARLDGEDACLLFAPGAGKDTIAWGNSAALRPGDTLHAMGHPGGSHSIIWSEGSLLQRSDHRGETFLISDNYCRPGSSGGPLLDDEGRLVGIVTAVQYFESKGGKPPQFGACISVTEATAKALLAKPLFPIALAPAQYIPKY